MVSCTIFSQWPPKGPKCRKSENRKSTMVIFFFEARPHVIWSFWSQIGQGITMWTPTRQFQHCILPPPATRSQHVWIFLNASFTTTEVVELNFDKNINRKMPIWFLDPHLQNRWDFKAHRRKLAKWNLDVVWNIDSGCVAVSFPGIFLEVSAQSKHPFPFPRKMHPSDREETSGLLTEIFRDWGFVPFPL